MVVAATLENDQRVVSRLTNLYLIARDHKRVRYDNWARNYRLVNNRFGGGQSSQYGPTPRSSEIYPHLSSLTAWMTDQDMDISFIPATDPHSDYATFLNMLADDLSAVTYSVWENEDCDAQVELGLWDAWQFGIGIYKTVWDNALDGGYGNSVIKRVDPWAFYTDPHASCLADAEYMVEVRRMSLDEIDRRYPNKSVSIEAGGGPIDSFDERPTLFDGSTNRPKANPGSIPASGTFGSFGSSSIPVWSRNSSSSKRLYEPLPGYIVYEFWIKQNTEDAPDYYQDVDKKEVDGHPQLAERFVREEWRCIIMCNGQILFDELARDLWSHAQHPYEDYRFDDTGEFYGISLVDHLAHPQIFINRLLAAMQQNAELTGNPVFVESSQSGLNRVSIVNKPGQRLTVNGPGGMANNMPAWLVPPPMPDQVMQLIQFWIDRIENVTGLDAMQRGAAPTQRSAEGTMQAVQEAAFVRIRSAQRNLERTLRRCIMKMSDLIIDNYTEPRFMAIVGPDGKQSSLALAGRHFFVPKVWGKTGKAEPLRVALVVRAGSRGPTSRSARIDEATTLFTLGAADDRYVMEAYGVKKVDDILKRLYYKRQQGLVGGGPSQRQRAGRQQ